MGTRSLTVVMDEQDPVVTIYRQFDGYPAGMGADLKKFLDGMTVVNGYNTKAPKRAANGMGCLAAQLVKYLKNEIGGVYLYPANSKDCGEEYRYTISGGEGIPLCIKVEGGYGSHFKALFEGPVTDFDPETCEQEGEK